MQRASMPDVHIGSSLFSLGKWTAQGLELCGGEGGNKNKNRARRLAQENQIQGVLLRSAYRTSPGRGARGAPHIQIKNMYTPKCVALSIQVSIFWALTEAILQQTLAAYGHHNTHHVVCRAPLVTEHAPVLTTEGLGHPHAYLIAVSFSLLKITQHEISFKFDHLQLHRASARLKLKLDLHVVPWLLINISG